MGSLQEIHKVALTELGKRISLDPVSLKYPFPERPARALGLIKIDGEVYSSERFSRVVLLKVDFPFYFSVRNIFLFPKKDYNLPFFTLDIVFKGKTRLIVMDVHRTEKGHVSADKALLEKLIKVKNKYSALLAETAKLESDILERLNREGQGVEGMGGNHTALAVNIEVFPSHIASLPVAVNIQCHAHRHKEITL